MKQLSRIVIFLMARAPGSVALALLLSVVVLVMGVSLLGLSGWFITAAAAAGLAGTGMLFNVFIPSAMVRFLALGRTAARYGERLATHDTVLKALADLRLQLLRGLLTRPHREIEKLRVAAELNRLTADVDALDGALLRLVFPGLAGAVVIGIASWALWVLVHPSVALVVGLGYLLAPSLVFAIGQARARASSRQAEAALQATRGRMVELVTAREDLTIHGQIPRAVAGCEVAIARHMQARARLDRLERVSGFGLDLVSGAIAAAALGLGATLAEAGQIEPARAAIGVFVALALGEAVQPVRRALTEIGAMRQAARRLAPALAVQTSAVNLNASDPGTAETSAIKVNASDPEAGQTSTINVNASNPGTAETSAVNVIASNSEAAQTSAINVNAPEPEAGQASAIKVNAPDPGTAETSAVNVNASNSEAAQTSAINVNAPEPEAGQASAIKVNAPDPGAAETSAVNVNASDPEAGQTSAINLNASNPGAAQTPTISLNAPDPEAAQPPAVTLNAPDPGAAPDPEAGPDAGRGNGAGLRFDAVSWKRRPGAPELFAPLSFSVAPGETVALTGASGIGKSTVLLMAAGVLPPASGHIRLEGEDVATLGLAEITARLVMVPQRHGLVSGSIAGNLRLAAPDARDDALWDALDATCLGQTIRDRGGLGLKLGARGAGLSGGEARRLVLARALLRRPRVLLLDEPTEGLDTPTAQRAMAGIRAALPGAAILVAAHRKVERDAADRCIALRHPAAP